jgi:carboxylesterase type B
MFLSGKYWTSWVNSLGDAKLANTIIGYWIQFAKAGDPSAPQLPLWPAYRPDAPMAQELGLQVGQIPVPHEAGKRIFEEMLQSQLQPGKAQ